MEDILVEQAEETFAVEQLKLKVEHIYIFTSSTNLFQLFKCNHLSFAF